MLGENCAFRMAGLNDDDPCMPTFRHAKRVNTSGGHATAPPLRPDFAQMHDENSTMRSMDLNELPRTALVANGMQEGKAVEKPPLQ